MFLSLSYTRECCTAISQLSCYPTLKWRKEAVRHEMSMHHVQCIRVLRICSTYGGSQEWLNVGSSSKLYKERAVGLLVQGCAVAARTEPAEWHRETLGYLKFLLESFLIYGDFSPWICIFATHPPPKKKKKKAWEVSGALSAITKSLWCLTLLPALCLGTR